MREYLLDWPLPVTKISYTIGTIVGNGLPPRFPDGPTPDNKISTAMYFKGRIHYLIKVKENKLPQPVLIETFEEAQAIVE